MMISMEGILIYVALVLGSLALGSFAGATVWRLRAKQLVAEKEAGFSVDKTELRQLKKISNNNIKDDRSVCLHCGHKLGFFDLIPILSWVALRGKCRYCKKPIGNMEPLIEVGMAAFFVLSFAFWPHEFSSWLEIAKLALWFLGGIGLAILFAYDAKWFLLPNVVMWSVIAAAGAYAGLTIYASPDPWAQAMSIAASILILSGLYLALYQFSKWKNGQDGTWVGFGDVKLGLALALFIADWRLALLALFLANLIGCIVVIPGLVSGKIGRQSHVPFGPLMIAGSFIAALFGEPLISAYLSLLY